MQNDHAAAAKKWLDVPLPSFCQGRPHLRLFDFDGTIVRSHDRDVGEILYFDHFNREWPFDGWWGRPETLQAPFFPDPLPAELLIQEVYDAFKAEEHNPQVWDVLLTGRPFKVRRRVQEICREFGMVFDEEFYRGMKGLSFSNDTFEIKIDIIRQQLLHNGLKSIEIYEDRQEHADRFAAAANSLKSLVGKNLEKIVLYNVPKQERCEL